MAKQRPSTQKRDREFRKRERERRKHEKAALKRERRFRDQSAQNPPPQDAQLDVASTPPSDDDS